MRCWWSGRAFRTPSFILRAGKAHHGIQIDKDFDRKVREGRPQRPQRKLNRPTAKSIFLRTRLYHRTFCAPGADAT